jgi:hypothetical protein
MARRLSEQLTRKEMIDAHLEKAGWYLRDYKTRNSPLPCLH